MFLRDAPNPTTEPYDRNRGRTAGVRDVIPDTDAIESLNFQLRKITKTRGHFPTDDAVLKIFYLGIRNIGHQRGGDLATGSQGWKQALNAFAITFPNRLPL